ncbi:MAG: T9SS type A sorting domain-containing protein [Chitinophagales bacterium]
MKKVFTLLTLCCTLLLTRAQFTFDVAGASETYVTDINDSSYICGYFVKNGVTSGFFYNGVDTVILDNTKVPTATSVWCGALNNVGQVAIYYNNGIPNNNFTLLWWWNTDSTANPYVIQGYNLVKINDLDDNLNISGDCINGTTDRRFFAEGPTVWDFTLHYSYLGTIYNTYGGCGMQGATYVTGYYIDGVEKHGFVYNSVLGTYTYIDLLNGGLSKTVINGINDHFHITLESGNISSAKGYICTDYSNAAANLRPILIKDAVAVHPLDINNYDNTCGYYTDAQGTVHGFFERAYDIGFRPKSFQGDGWTFLNTDTVMWPSSEYVQSYATDPYDPNVDWQLGSNPKLPPVSVFPSWPLFVRTFGEDKCYYTDDNGVKHLRSQMREIWAGQISTENGPKKWGGSCFGLSATSIVRFNHQDIFETRFPGLVEPIGSYMTDFFNVHDTRDACNQMQAAQSSVTYFGILGQNTAFTDMLAALKANLADTSASARHVVLDMTVLIDNVPQGAHAVVPYRIQKDTVNNNGDEWIYIYDSNHPGDLDRKIIITTLPGAGGLYTWKYLWHASTGVGDPDVYWGNGFSGYNGSLRIMDPYPALEEQQIPVPGGGILASIADQSRAAGQFTFHSNDSTWFLITNQAGDTTANYGSLQINNIPNATAHVPLTGNYSRTNTYSFDAGDVYTVNLKANISGPLKTWMQLDSANLLAFKIDSTAPAENHLGGMDDGLSYTNPEAGTKKVNFIASVSNNYYFMLNEVPLGQNERLKIKPVNGTQLQVENTGPQTHYGLDVRVELQSGLVNLHFDSIPFAANTNHIIQTQFDSSSSSGVLIFVDNAQNGSTDDTLFFQSTLAPELVLGKYIDSLPFTAGVDTVGVANSGGGQLNWSVTSSPNWVTVTSGNSGSQSGKVVFNYSANTGAPRSGLLIVEAAGALNSPDTVYLYQAGTTAINSVSSDEIPLMIYPNPFKDELRIQRLDDGGGEMNISIFDAAGRMVDSYLLGSNTETARLQLQKLSEGIYFIHVQCGKASRISKFLRY